MELFSTVAKLFVWRLRLRPQKHGHPVANTGCTKSKICFPLQIFADFFLILTFQMTKTFRKTVISIFFSKEAASKLFFPDVCTQWKMYFFFPFVRPCMHQNHGVISGCHTSTDNFCCRALYNLPWRVSVSSHQVQCSIPTFEALLRKNVYLFLEKSPARVWLRALMQSDSLYRYSSLFFEHYNRVLLCDWVPGGYTVSFADHNAFVLHQGWTLIL